MRGRFGVIILLSTLFLGALSFGAGWGSFTLLERLPYQLPFLGTNPVAVETATRMGQSEVSEDEMAIFWEAMKLLDENYYSTEEIPTGEDRTYAAIEGLVNATGDPHTGFLNPEDAALVETRLEGEFEGIGATVEMSDQGLVIVAPFPNTPAEAAGLRPGDLVVEVDGTPTRGLALLEAVAMVRGPQGTVVTLTIQRAGSTELMTVEVTRGTIIIPIVETRLIEPPGAAPIGYIQLTDFGGQSVEQFEEGLRELLDQGAERLIVDVRNNPGGYLQASVEIASEFIADGLILSEEGSNGRKNLHYAEPGGIATDIPVVLLINEGSASASEILAGALQDHERGTLIGETTFGKGSVQITHDLSDGSNLRVTIAHWFTPDGRAIHEVGIEPDIEVAWDFTTRTYLEDIALPVTLTDAGLEVVATYPGTLAEEAGLQAGDLIVEVDGIDTRELTVTEVIPLGQGPEGSEAHLLVLRGGEGEAERITVTRDYPDTPGRGDPQLEAAIDYFMNQN